MADAKKKKKAKLGRRLLTFWPTRVLVELWVWSLATFMTLPGPRWAYLWGRVLARLGWMLLPRLRA